MRKKLGVAALAALAITGSATLPTASARAATGTVIASGLAASDNPSGAYVVGYLYRIDNPAPRPDEYYVRLQVEDNRADGKCAHGRVFWYMGDAGVVIDANMWVCGNGNSYWFPPTPNRIGKGSISVNISAFVDGGKEKVVNIYDH